MKVLRCDFMPSDLAEHLNEDGIDGCIAVQADQTEKNRVSFTARPSVFIYQRSDRMD